MTQPIQMPLFADGTSLSALEGQMRPNVLHFAASGLLFMSIAASLAAYFSIWPAALLALLMASVFGLISKKLFEQKGWLRKVPYALSLVPLAMISVALTSSTIYQAVFAQGGALRYFAQVREPYERSLDARLTMLSVVEGSVQAWRDDASDKATKERSEGGGGTCPTRDTTQGVEGPISRWRDADALVAADLLRDLSAERQALSDVVSEINKAPKAVSFDDVVKQMDLLSRGADIIARVGGESGLAQSAKKVVVDRQDSQIITRSGAEIDCGDTGRFSLLERARVALESLANATPMNRLTPPINLNDRAEVTSVALIRNTNAVAQILSLGHLGSFADDVLMSDALKVSFINRETLPLMLALILEMLTLYTGFLAAQRLLAGTRPVFEPFDWAGQSQSPTALSKAKYIAMGLVQAVVNAVWLRVPVEVDASGLPPHHKGTQLNRAKGPLTDVDRPATWLVRRKLRPDGLFPQREATWAQDLVGYYRPYLKETYLVVPQTDTQARAMAHALVAKGLAKVLCEPMSPSDLPLHLQTVANTAAITAANDTHIGEAEPAKVEVFKVRDGHYCQALRLAAIGG
jgi:hypothetical protein